MDTERGNVDATCVDAVHPRIHSITSKSEHKLKGGSASTTTGSKDRRDDDENCPILVDFSSSESSINTRRVDHGCLICGNLGHSAAKECITTYNSVKLFQTRNSNGTITSKFVFPTNSACKSYLPNKSLDQCTSNATRELDDDVKRTGIKSLTCCWKL